MTDLPELITNVYRACGKDTDAWDRWGDADVGLDAFVRDIVPTLHERGWRWDWMGQFFSDWAMTLRHVSDETKLCIATGGTPVEACFRAAWEALKDDTTDA